MSKSIKCNSWHSSRTYSSHTRHCAGTIYALPHSTPMTSTEGDIVIMNKWSSERLRHLPKEKTAIEGRARISLQASRLLSPHSQPLPCTASSSNSSDPRGRGGQLEPKAPGRAHGDHDRTGQEVRPPLREGEPGFTVLVSGAQSTGESQGPVDVGGSNSSWW